MTDRCGLVIFLPRGRPFLLVRTEKLDLRRDVIVCEIGLDVGNVFVDVFILRNVNAASRDALVAIEDGFVDQIAVYGLETCFNIAVILDHNRGIQYGHDSRNGVKLRYLAGYFQLCPNH